MDKLNNAISMFSGFPAYLVVTTSSYFFFHWLFLRARPKDAVFWKMADVYWLAVGIVAVAVAFSQSRVSKDEEFASRLAYKSNYTRNQVKETFEVFLNSSLCSSTEPRTQPPTAFVQEIDRQCRWAREAFKRFKRFRADQTVSGVIDEMRYPMPEGGSTRFTVQLREDVQRYDVTQGGTDLIKAAATYTWWEKALRSLAPYILAFALGFRLVKARADVLAEIEKIKPNSPPKPIKAPTFSWKRFWL